MKRVFAWTLVLLLALGCFAGCGSQTTVTPTADAPQSETILDENTPPVIVDGPSTEGDYSSVDYPATSGDLPVQDMVLTLVIAGSFGDRSFYDSAKGGVDRLAADLGMKIRTIECNNDNFDSQMRNAADSANIVVCVGWEFFNIEQIAPEYENVRWIWIDNATSEPIPNVLNITYAQNEGSYLAGYIAAAMSKHGVIGAVGGEDSDTINDFIVGYKQGAEAYDPEIDVVVKYAGTYDDPSVGKECAFALNDQGADVIFQIASATGDGVFEAAASRGFYAIGVDSDQKYINEDVIICSMKKEVGNSIYDAVMKLNAGDVSLWGTTWVADMSNGYVGIGYGEAGSKQQISDELKAEVEALAAKIVSGEIVVNTTR